MDGQSTFADTHTVPEIQVHRETQMSSSILLKPTENLGILSSRYSL